MSEDARRPVWQYSRLSWFIITVLTTCIWTWPIRSKHLGRRCGLSRAAMQQIGRPKTFEACEVECRQFRVATPWIDQVSSVLHVDGECLDSLASSSALRDAFIGSAEICGCGTLDEDVIAALPWNVVTSVNANSLSVRSRSPQAAALNASYDGVSHRHRVGNGSTSTSTEQIKLRVKEKVPPCCTGDTTSGKYLAAQDRRVEPGLPLCVWAALLALGHGPQGA